MPLPFQPVPATFGEGNGPLAFAHRGGAAEAPENSWAAFERAAALGYRYMETDVRASADGVAVAIHDPTVGRVAKGSGSVSEMTWQQLERLELRGGGGIPNLEDLLGTWPELSWNIDVKARAAVEPVIGALRRTSSMSRVLVAAFSARRSRKLRDALGPGLAIGAGRGAVAALVCAKYLPWLPVRSDVVAAQVPTSRNGVRIVDSRFVATCHSKGLAVHVWTINDAGQMSELLDLGVDGIMTDCPSVLKKVLEQRGQWHEGG